MVRNHRRWLSGLACMVLSAFVVAGCRSAPQVANQPETVSPAVQSPAQTGAGAKKGRAAGRNHKAHINLAQTNRAHTNPAQTSPVQTNPAQPNPAQPNQQLKADAQQAASDTTQVADSLLIGLKKDLGQDPYPPSDAIVNINYSSEERLLALPGINHELAMLIIRNRPYETPTDLIAKHVLTKQEFDRIKDRLTAWDNLWTNPDD